MNGYIYLNFTPISGPDSKKCKVWMVTSLSFIKVFDGNTQFKTIQ